MPNPKKPRPLCQANCGKEACGWDGLYCSNKCQQTHTQQLWIQRWLAGELSESELAKAKRVRSVLILLYGAKCQLCGWSEIHPITKTVPVQVDHLDGNTKNNRPNNVRLLCPNCHSLTVNWGALNGKKPHAVKKIPILPNTSARCRGGYHKACSGLRGHHTDLHPCECPCHKLERETGFEPATSTLATLHSTS